MSFTERIRRAHIAAAEHWGGMAHECGNMTLVNDYSRRAYNHMEQADRLAALLGITIEPKGPMHVDTTAVKAARRIYGGGP